MRKILVFSPFYPPHVGGLESHSDEFNKHLSRKGVSISVFTPRLPVDAREGETRHTEVTITRFPAFEPIHNYPIPKFWTTRFWQQWKTLGATDYDIVISRTRFFFPSLMALWYAYRHHLPLLHIEHGSDFAQFNSELKTALGKCYDCTVGRFLLRHADGIIANSQASARFVKKLSERTDCQVIYRGANTEGIATVQPNKELAKKYHNKTIIAFIGRLIDGKGAHDLITAVTRLKRNDIVTFIIGGGPEEVRLKTMVSHYHLKERVIFFGNLPFEEAISILKTAHIVVNPSYTEGLPTSVTEAALCHKAIIATSVGGTPEVISGQSDGVLVLPKQPEAIAEKLVLLIDNPKLREELGEAAFKSVNEKFSWEHASDQYLEVFSKLRENRKKPS